LAIALHSDFEMPAVIGIQTKLYIGTRLNNSETAIVSDAFASAEMLLRPQLTGLMASRVDDLIDNPSTPNVERDWW
jgi:hypothetical protein